MGKSITEKDIQKSLIRKDVSHKLKSHLKFQF